MKIGVVTFWNSNSNYGQILQCWALQSFLKKLGHNSYVIRFIPASYTTPFKRFVKKILFIDKLKSLKSFLFDYKSYQINKKNKYNDTKRQFDLFRLNNIEFSEFEYYDIYDIQKNPPVADVYITGSDQVWAQMLDNINSRVFYLDFGTKEIKRISYAPSFVFQEYPAKYRAELKSLLSNFDAVSSREYSGVDICKSVGINAIKVLDPTFLLDKEEYISLIGDCIQKKKQVFIYSLNISSPEQIKWDNLKRFVKNNNLFVTVTPSKGYFEGNEIFNDEVEYSYATPQLWLKNIAESQLVVTPSFHGIVFSIIMQTPFVYIPLRGKSESGNNRVTDLLKDLGLENRILYETCKYESIISHNINWDEVALRLAFYKNISKEFLAFALK